MQCLLRKRAKVLNCNLLRVLEGSGVGEAVGGGGDGGRKRGVDLVLSSLSACLMTS